jgi:tetratricopeptide (TPR) repeat protein
VWLGLGPVESRLDTVWGGEVLGDVRFAVWADLAGAVRDFPVLGTGYGTLTHVEQLYRRRSHHASVIFEAAHNDYLEAAVEGGLPRLALSVLAVVLVLRLGWRALRRHAGKPAGNLVAGALFGFIAVALHSFGDFGLHVPAVAVLVTVLAAQLAALGAPDAEGSQGEARPLRVGGPAPLAALALAVALGWVLCAEGWKAARVEGLLRAAQAPGEGATPAARLPLFDEAVRLCPERADVRFETGQAYLLAYQAEREHAETQRWRRRALTELLAARDLCPLLGRAHLRLAASASYLGDEEPRAAHLRRAKRLLAFDPEVWYLAGLLELEDGRAEETWRSWRRSLELSDVHLGSILDRCAPLLDPTRVVEKVLPDRPGILLAAAHRLSPELGPPVRPLLERALELLAQGSNPGAQELWLQGEVRAALGDVQGALSCSEFALRLAPGRADWRYQYARLLRGRGRLKEARSQLMTVLDQEPGHQEARRLLEEVARGLAER